MKKELLPAAVTTDRNGDTTPSSAPTKGVSPLLYSFAITYPTNNTVVRKQNIAIKGEGAKPGSTIEVSVYSNKWYLQDGQADINPTDWTWTYEPIHLMGRGQYNKHTIKAKLLYDGELLAVKKIIGVRVEPYDNP